MRWIACSAIVIAALAANGRTPAGPPEPATPAPQPVEAQSKKRLNFADRGVYAPAQDRLRRRILSAEELKMERILSQEVSLSFDNSSLREVFVQLGREAGLNIFVDTAGLKAEGLTPDTKVSIDVSAVPLKSALQQMLEPLRLTYAVKDDVLKISSLEPPELEALLTVNYPVSDLVMLPADPARKIPEEPPAINADFVRLMDHSTPTIDPLSWENRGGRGSMMSYRTTLSLVIRQTEAVHDQISDLLGQLRRPGQLAVRLKVALLTTPEDKLPRFARADAVDPKASSIAKNATDGEGFVLRDANARLLLNYATRRPAARVTRMPPPGLVICDGQTSGLDVLAAVAGSAHTTFGFKISAVIAGDRETLRLRITAATGDEEKGDAPSISFGLRHAETIACDVTRLLQAYRESKARANGVDAAAPAQRESDGTMSTSTGVREFLIITARVLAPIDEEELRGVDLPKR